MSDTVIRVENVSKLYRLGEVGTGSLAHDVNRWWHKVRGKEDPYLKIGEVNDRTKPAKQARTDGGSQRTDGTTNHTNKHENLTTEGTESTERAAGGNQGSDSGEFWKATRKRACRWTPKNSLPFALRMPPALLGAKMA
jgi:hypothetical protein